MYVFGCIVLDINTSKAPHFIYHSRILDYAI